MNFISFAKLLIDRVSSGRNFSVIHTHIHTPQALAHTHTHTLQPGQSTRGIF